MRRASMLGCLTALAACPGPFPQDAGPVLGGSCDLASTSDVCALSGLVCHPDSTGQGSCGLALFGEPCLPRVGCASGDAGDEACQTFADPDGGAEPNARCAPPCQSAADCPDATTDCFPLVGGDGGACATNVCTPVFALCASGGSSLGGTCLPRGSRGLCIQSGSAALGGACNTSRADAGAGLCEPGDVCVHGSPAGPQPDLALCEPLCGGSLTCPGATKCAYTVGLCLAACTANVQPGCASPLVCLPTVAPTGEPAGSFCQLP